MNRSKNRGFTLVEMLVVISIIGILAGLLLPTLSNSIAKAREMHCINNCGQHAKAMIQLAAQNNNRTIQPDASGHWMASLDLILNAGQRTDLRLCPNAVRANPTRGAVDRAWTYNGWVGSLAVNTHVANRSPSGNDYTLMSQTESRTPAFCDGAWYETGPIGGISWPPNLDGASNWILNRHRRAISVGFCDGHAERVELAMIWSLKWHRNFTPAGRQTNPALGIR